MQIATVATGYHIGQCTGLVETMTAAIQLIGLV